MSFLSSLYSLSLCAVNLPHFQSLQSGGPAAPGSHGPTPRAGATPEPHSFPSMGCTGGTPQDPPGCVLGVSHPLHKPLSTMTTPGREMGDHGHVTALTGTQQCRGTSHIPLWVSTQSPAARLSSGGPWPRAGVQPCPGCSTLAIAASGTEGFLLLQAVAILIWRIS